MWTAKRYHLKLQRHGLLPKGVQSEQDRGQRVALLYLVAVLNNQIWLFSQRLKPQQVPIEEWVDPFLAVKKAEEAPSEQDSVQTLTALSQDHTVGEEMANSAASRDTSKRGEKKKQSKRDKIKGDIVSGRQSTRWSFRQL